MHTIINPNIFDFSELSNEILSKLFLTIKDSPITSLSERDVKKNLKIVIDEFLHQIDKNEIIFNNEDDKNYIIAFLGILLNFILDNKLKEILNKSYQ